MGQSSLKHNMSLWVYYCGLHNDVLVRDKGCVEKRHCLAGSVYKDCDVKSQIATATITPSGDVTITPSGDVTQWRVSESHLVDACRAYALARSYE